MGDGLPRRRRGDRDLAEGRRPARPSGSCAGARRTTSGRWASPARAARAPSSSTTAAPSTAPRAARRSTRTATWSSGTSSSCSTSRGRARAKEDFPILGDLPAKNIDTGMGLERIASILQGVDNLYEIDEVRPILDRAAELTGKRYGAHSGHVASESHPDDVRLRVIADHVRTALMLIGDGVTPATRAAATCCAGSCAGRSGRCGCSASTQPALPELLPVARNCMAPSYPELATDFGRISPVRVRRGGGVPVARCARAPRSWTPRSRETKTAGATTLCRRRRRSSCTTRTASRST